MPHHVLNMTQTLFLLLQLPDHIIIVMVEGAVCHLLVLRLLLQQLADHQLTSALFLHLPLQIHRLAAAVIADSKAGSDWLVLLLSVPQCCINMCRTLCAYCLNSITQRNLLYLRAGVLQTRGTT